MSFKTRYYQCICNSPEDYLRVGFAQYDDEPQVEVYIAIGNFSGLRLWNRLKLAWRILRGLGSETCNEVLLTEQQAFDLGLQLQKPLKARSVRSEN